MTLRSERRHLDDTIRTAVHGAFTELMKPLLEQADFQKRLAMAIAARMPAPAAVAAPPPAKAKPAPKATAPRQRLDEGEIRAIGRAFLETGSAAETRRRCPHLPKTTVYSAISRRSWERLPPLPDEAPPEAPAAEAVPEVEVAPPAAEAEPAAAAAAETAPVVPEEAPGPAVEPPTVRQLPSWAPQSPAATAPPPAPSEPPENQATYTTTKAVRDWLERHLVLGGMGKLAASDRVAAMTHQEALQEANRRRAGLRMRPFIFIGTKVEA